MKWEPKTYLVLAVDRVAHTGSLRTVVAPAGTPLPVGAVASHMASIPTDAANDAGRIVGLVGTVVLAVSDAATVLARLVLVITQGTVQGCQFS